MKKCVNNEESWLTGCHCVRQCYCFFRGDVVDCDQIPYREKEKARFQAVSSVINNKCSCCTDLLSLMVKTLKLDINDDDEDDDVFDDDSDEDREKNKSKNSSMQIQEPFAYKARNLLSLPSFMSVVKKIEGGKGQDSDFEEWKKDQREKGSSAYFEVSAPVLRSKTYQRLYSDWRKKKLCEIRAIIASQTRDFLGYLNILADFSKLHGLDDSGRTEDASLPKKLAYCLLREAREMSEFFVPYNLWDPEVDQYDKDYLAQVKLVKRKEISKRKFGEEEEEEREDSPPKKKMKKEEVKFLKIIINYYRRYVEFFLGVRGSLVRRKI